MRRPRVLVVTRRTTRKTMWIDYVAEAHLKLLIQLDTLPVMVPVAEGVPDCLPDYMTEMRGLLLVEGEDIEPKNYEATPENYEHLEKTHPLKDEVELRLIRHAIENHVPYLGICRGSQLLNVACGGTLYGDVQKEKKSHLKHINFDHYHTYRHPISIRAGSPLHKWYGRRTLEVNSYHHQGVRDLAPRFRMMAHAKDGLVEAYYDPHVDFLVGLQFHPERMREEPDGNWRIWQAFGEAIHRAANKKTAAHANTR